MLNDHDLATMALFASSLLFVSTVTFAWLWARTRERALRAELERRNAVDRPEELQALSQAVEAIAIEVERIAEGQRFTTKLLSERVEGGAAVTNRPPARVITPH
jgi:hypothetical protein